jgi:hypothetical protein
MTTSDDSGAAGGVEPTAFGPDLEQLRHGSAHFQHGVRRVQEAESPKHEPEQPDARATVHRASLAPEGVVDADVRVMDRLRARLAEQLGGDQ